MENIGIGIDTGGTYTDAVIFDIEEKRVLAESKALTTKEDLTIGINEALENLPPDMVSKAKTIALSTTLATNACVENKGGRAKLILAGTTKKTLEWIGADKKYGLKSDDILCVDSKSSFDGKIIEEPCWEKIINESENWLSTAEALAVTEIYSFKNGAVIEKNAKKILEEKFCIPIILASDLVSGLDMMERGATALLNARLLPIINDFLNAADASLKRKGLFCKQMIARSDGSLMSGRLSRIKPVETILSGPAASVLGARFLTNQNDCIIVDMGGTTTDISLIKNGKPVMANGGISIGGWRTQVNGVFMDTFALGGDTEIKVKDGTFTLGTRRVIPLCVASKRYKNIKNDLNYMLSEITATHYYPPEFVCLIKKPKNKSQYSEEELKLCSLIEDEPCLAFEISKKLNESSHKINLERLESEGLIMRSAMTPTDFMHIKGDFSLYDKEASSLAANYFLRILPFSAEEEFANAVYDEIEKKLFKNIIRILFCDKYPELSGNIGTQLENIISSLWHEQDKSKKPFFLPDFQTNAVLVGVGAPTHLFLPKVAEALKTDYVIPKNAAVANAVGAICADITVSFQVEIKPASDSMGINGYFVYTKDKKESYQSKEDAYNAAILAAEAAAINEARIRGAIGELSIKREFSENSAFAKEGEKIDLGSFAKVTVSGFSD